MKNRMLKAIVIGGLVVSTGFLVEPSWAEFPGLPDAKEITNDIKTGVKDKLRKEALTAKEEIRKRLEQAMHEQLARESKRIDEELEKKLAQL